VNEKRVARLMQNMGLAGLFPRRFPQRDTRFTRIGCAGWRSRIPTRCGVPKYEDIYLKDYATVAALHTGLAQYFHFYNEVRPHQSLGYCTPAEV
jgi:hypothetical protein